MTKIGNGVKDIAPRDSSIKKRWYRLRELNKEIEMVVIGGWAVYLYTKLSKSKDIDIVIDYGTLRKLDSEYTLVKMTGLINMK